MSPNLYPKIQISIILIAIRRQKHTFLAFPLRENNQIFLWVEKLSNQENHGKSWYIYLGSLEPAQNTTYIQIHKRIKQCSSSQKRKKKKGANIYRWIYLLFCSERGELLQWWLRVGITTSKSFWSSSVYLVRWRLCQHHHKGIIVIWVERVAMTWGRRR